MQIPHEAVLLRIFIGESDRWHHGPLYEAIVLKARELHLAGGRYCVGRWVSANPAADTPRKSFASRWTSRWSSKS